MARLSQEVHLEDVWSHIIRGKGCALRESDEFEILVVHAMNVA